MIIRVPLGEIVEINNADATALTLPLSERPMTMQDWSTLANVCSAYCSALGIQPDAETRRFVEALRDKCIERMNAISHNVVVP